MPLTHDPERYLYINTTGNRYQLLTWHLKFSFHTVKHQKISLVNLAHSVLSYYIIYIYLNSSKSTLLEKVTYTWTVCSSALTSVRVVLSFPPLHLVLIRRFSQVWNTESVSPSSLNTFPNVQGKAVESGSDSPWSLNIVSRCINEKWSRERTRGGGNKTAGAPE